LRVFLNEAALKLGENIKTVVALGAFDGLHRGHLSLIEKAVEQAKGRGCKTLVYSFLNHPQSVLNPSGAPLALMTFDEKIRMFDSLGVDYLALMPFSFQMAQIDPEEFLQKLAAQVVPVAIVAGFNFRFGRDGAGNAEFLEKFCVQNGIDAYIMPPVSEEGAPISSSRIRALIADGDMEAAASLLGRPYTVSGTVVAGKKLGRTIGFRTANLDYQPKLLPRFGVYVCYAYVLGKRYESVVNVGNNPTVSDKGKVFIEANLFDCEDDLYGLRLKLEFLHKIRDEQRFGSIDQLKDAIADSVACARAYFAGK
jgi:riboflavin kinase/FMN adenylyltransferase